MQKIAFLLALCVCILVYPFNTSAAYTDGELEAYKDEIYTKGELTLITTVYYDPNDYVGEGPFDFLGVDIVEITCRSSMPEGEIPTNGIWYEIRLADNWKTYEAILVLESNETAKSVYLNSLVYPDAPVDQPMESVSWFRYIGENVEDIKWNDEFISTVFIVEADRPLAPVVVDGKEYFFGLSLERFVDLSKNGEYRYEVKLEYDRASSIVPKATMKRVIECGEGVTNVTISTIYGSGDTNYDDVIDVYDYILVKRMCMETYDWPFTSQVGAADINLDSKVDQYDYILVKRHVLGTYEIADNTTIK